MTTLILLNWFISNLVKPQEIEIRHDFVSMNLEEKFTEY